MSHFGGVPRPQAKELQLLPLPMYCDVIVGTAAVEVTRPAGRTGVVLKVVSNNFYITAGGASDFITGDFSAEDFEAMFTDPSSTTYGVEDSPLYAFRLSTSTAEQAFLCPEVFTIKGDNAASKVYMYFF